MTYEMADHLLLYLRQQQEVLGVLLDSPLPGPKEELRKAFAH